MPGEDLAWIEQAAVEITAAAGERAVAAFRRRLALEFKGKRQDDPVTAADREIESYLRSELRARFPGHGFVGEEHQDELAADTPYVWVIDPLDGTANFAAGLPIWGVSVGLMHLGRPVVGCVWVPVGPGLRSGIYHAREGGGAWFEGERVSVASGQDERGRIIALPGRYWLRFRFKRPRAGLPRLERVLPDNRVLGSIAAELVLVAAGVLRLAVFVEPRIWDVLAGALIAREAGATVQVWQHRGWRPLQRYVPMLPSRRDGPAAYRYWSRPVLVGAPGLAARAMERLAWHPRLPRLLARLLGFRQR